MSVNQSGRQPTTSPRPLRRTDRGEGVRVPAASTQRRSSRISLTGITGITGLTGRTWSERAGDSPAATYNAEVYVFCVRTATRHEDYDPLDVRQWDVYVLSRTRVGALGYKSPLF